MTMNNKRSQKRFKADHDRFLMSEVDSLNPFCLPNKSLAWEEVVPNLNKIQSQVNTVALSYAKTKTV